MIDVEIENRSLVMWWLSLTLLHARANQSYEVGSMNLAPSRLLPGLRLLAITFAELGKEEEKEWLCRGVGWVDFVYGVSHARLSAQSGTCTRQGLPYAFSIFSH